MNIIPNPDSITQEDQCCLISSSKILKHYNYNNIDSKEIIDEDVKCFFENSAKTIGWIDDEQCILIKDNNPSLPNNVDYDGRNKHTFKINKNTIFYIFGEINNKQINKIYPYINESLFDKLSILDNMFHNLSKDRKHSSFIRNGILNKSKNNTFCITQYIDSDKKDGILLLSGTINFPFFTYGIYLNVFENTIYTKHNYYISHIDQLDVLNISKKDVNNIFNKFESEYCSLDEFIKNQNNFKKLLLLTKEEYEKGLTILVSMIKDRLNNLDDVTLLNLVQNNFETI